MVGTFCISIDLELGWGIWDKPDPDYFARCADREHRIVHALLDQFTRHEIAATWAFVSRLLELDEARARSTAHGAAIWYAPELIDAIRTTPVEQELGSHGYAHLYFGETPASALRADLASARQAHARHGIAFDSFVFPRNQVAHVDLLAEAGVKVYRSVDEGWHVTVRDRLGGRPGRFAHLAANVVPIAPKAVRARRSDSLVELPSSMLFLGRKGVRRFIPPAALVARARRGLTAAADHGGCFHLWLHPSNFYHRTDEQLAAFDAILASAAKLRGAGRLRCVPMREFAAA